MTVKCYINGIGTVNPQGVWRSSLLEEAQPIHTALAYAQQPSYKDLIAPAMVRRMSKGVKMGIHAAQQALDDAQVSDLDAIMTGTGLGCLEDSEKFLKAVLDNDEEFLTPTAFIQSTHNTVGAQIALRLACKAYNFTYVHGTVSFESALLDGLMQLQSEEAKQILVGGIDEISDHAFTLKQLIQKIKPNDVHETIQNSTTKGINFGEGGTFFVLCSEQTENSYVELLDVQTQSQLSLTEIDGFVESFLAKNNLKKEDISLLGVGVSGDIVHDAYYRVFGEQFTDRTQFYYKHLVGHSDVASAFGLAIAADALKKQYIDLKLIWQAGTQPDFTHVLLYNQHQGRDHSLTLVKRVG